MTARPIDPADLAAFVAAQSPEERAAGAQRVRDELARRAAEGPAKRASMIAAADRLADVQALCALAELLADDADEPGRRELIFATIDRAAAAVTAIREALAQS